MKQLTFVTGNKNKAKQLARFLDFEIDNVSLDIDEIQSLSVTEVAKEKARVAYEQLQRPILVEDTSLTFTALNGLPGPLIKWFLDTIGTEGLCNLLKENAERSAVAETCFVLHDETGQYEFNGVRHGKVAPTPRGDDFGWNPIFIPDDSEQTWGEMSEEASRAHSMRKLAVDKLKLHLNTYYQ